MTIDPVDGSSLFHSEAMQKIIRVVERIAATEVAVLLTGESGTGKELIADLIHIRSGRPNISKISSSALEPKPLDDICAETQGGTLFMRDLCELPSYTQGTLLSWLDKQGSPLAPRIIAATSQKPEDAVKKGTLLAELYYRINGIRLHLPPLRERREDIMPFAEAFLKRFADDARRPIRGFTPAAAELLDRFYWPGNVSQLQNEIHRAVLLGEGDQIDAPHLSIFSSTDSKAGSDEPQDTNFTFLKDVERNAIVQMLKETGGNKQETARRLGIGRQTLYNKIKAYQIEI